MVTVTRERDGTRSLRKNGVRSRGTRENSHRLPKRIVFCVRPSVLVSACRQLSWSYLVGPQLDATCQFVRVQFPRTIRIDLTQ